MWKSQSAKCNIKKQTSLYSVAMKEILSLFHKVGKLGGNHLMLMCCVIGIIPLCFASEFHRKSPACVTLGRRFKFGSSATKVQEYLTCLATYMRNDGIYCNQRIAEQVTCKSLHKEQCKNSVYKDLYIANTNVYKMGDNNQLSIHFPPITKKLLGLVLDFLSTSH